MTYKKKGYNPKSKKNIGRKLGTVMKSNRCIMENCKGEKALRTQLCLYHLYMRYLK